MRAYIGPYKTWWGPFQIADLLQKVGVSEERCYAIGEWLKDTWVYDVCLWIDQRRERKISIKVDKWDSWSADSTIAMIAVPVIKQLRTKKNGIPGKLIEGPEFDIQKIRRYNEILMNDDYSKEGEEKRNKEYAEAEVIWNEILDEMIFGLEACYVHDHEPDFWIVKPEIEFKDCPDNPGFVEMLHNGTIDQKAYEAYHDRVQNGLILFGKYFRTLWD